jgi:hypothetical protein
LEATHGVCFGFGNKGIFGAELCDLFAQFVLVHPLCVIRDLPLGIDQHRSRNSGSSDEFSYPPIPIVEVTLGLPFLRSKLGGCVSFFVLIDRKQN